MKEMKEGLEVYVGNNRYGTIVDTYKNFVEVIINSAVGPRKIVVRKDEVRVLDYAIVMYDEKGNKLYHVYDNKEKKNVFVPEDVFESYLNNSTESVNAKLYDSEEEAKKVIDTSNFDCPCSVIFYLRDWFDKPTHYVVRGIDCSDFEDYPIENPIESFVKRLKTDCHIFECITKDGGNSFDVTGKSFLFKDGVLVQVE